MKVRFAREIDASELLPPVSRDSHDIQEIMRIHNVELNELWNVMLDILCNQFIKYATEYGLSQWEGILDLPSDGRFEERRILVLRELMGLRPYTLESFQNMLDTMYGEGAVGLELGNDKYELWFNTTATTTYKVNEIYAFADIIVPKNLKILFKNVKSVTESIYIGSVVKFKKKIHIGADMGFRIDPLQHEPYIGGVVGFKRVKLKI